MGLNESEASARGVPFEVTRYGFDELDRAIADSEAHGMIKVLTAPGKDRILGATVAGEHAGDLLMEFVLAMRHGLGLKKLLGTIHIYPTMAEGARFAAGNWRREHAPERGAGVAGALPPLAKRRQLTVIGRTPPVGLVATDLDGTLARLEPHPRTTGCGSSPAARPGRRRSSRRDGALVAGG